MTKELTDDEIKRQLIDDLNFLQGMFVAYCMDNENRALFSYGMARLRLYIEGKLTETEDKSMSEELLRSYQ